MSLVTEADDVAQQNAKRLEAGAAAAAERDRVRAAVALQLGVAEARRKPACHDA